MTNSFLFFLVAAFCFIVMARADTDEMTSPIAVMQGTKSLEGILGHHHLPKSRCHAGYGLCPDEHCCPIGGDCCEAPGTCCPRDYYCMKGKYGREGCCPKGRKCSFGDDRKSW